MSYLHPNLHIDYWRQCNDSWEKPARRTFMGNCISVSNGEKKKEDMHQAARLMMGDNLSQSPLCLCISEDSDNSMYTTNIAPISNCMRKSTHYHTT